jgi:hypothetical protein
MQHVWGTGQAYKGLWWENLREEYHMEDPGIDGTTISQLHFEKLDWEAGTGLIWLRIGTGRGCL